PKLPRVSWFGEGRACTNTTGWFGIDAITIEAGALKHIDLRFEQRCSYPTTAGALHRPVLWTPGRPGIPPPPADPPPARPVAPRRRSDAAGRELPVPAIRARRLDGPGPHAVLHQGQRAARRAGLRRPARRGGER